MARFTNPGTAASSANEMRIVILPARCANEVLGGAYDWVSLRLPPSPRASRRAMRRIDV